MISNQLVFTVPYPTTGMNSRDHWRTRKRKRDEYHARLTVMRMNGELPRRGRTAWHRARVAVTIYPHGKHLDTDNAMSRMKDAIDWLVKERYIVDDSPRHLEWAGVPEQESPPCAELRGWCVLTLTQLEAKAA